MFKVPYGLSPLLILTPLPHNYCPTSPISLLTRLTLDHGRVRFQVSSSFSRFARGALWLNCLLAYERKVQCSKFKVQSSKFKVQCSKFLPLLFPPSSFLVKTNNHKKHNQKGTTLRNLSYLCTRKYVCRDSAISAFSVKNPRRNSPRHSQGAVNKHVAFSDHYMLLVFSAGIDCLFRKTPHYLLR